MTDLANSRNTEVWTFVFKKAQQKHWVHNFTRPDFQHVIAMKKSLGGQFWLIADVSVSKINMLMEPVSAFPTAREMFPDATEIITVTAANDTKVHNKHLTLVTCVGAVKAILNVKDPLCFTPYKLFKNLLGGKYERCTATRQERCGTRSEATAATSTRTTVPRPQEEVRS